MLDASSRPKSKNRCDTGPGTSDSGERGTIHRSEGAVKLGSFPQAKIKPIYGALMLQHY